MALEQIKPKQPNFLLILILSVIALPIIFLIVWLVLRFSGKSLVPGSHAKHPTSQFSAPPLRPVPSRTIYFG